MELQEHTLLNRFKNIGTLKRQNNAKLYLADLLWVVATKEEVEHMSKFEGNQILNEEDSVCVNGVRFAPSRFASLLNNAARPCCVGPASIRLGGSFQSIPNKEKLQSETKSILEDVIVKFSLHKQECWITTKEGKELDLATIFKKVATKEELEEILSIKTNSLAIENGTITVCGVTFEPSRYANYLFNQHIPMLEKTGDGEKAECKIEMEGKVLDIVDIVVHLEKSKSDAVCASIRDFDAIHITKSPFAPTSAFQINHIEITWEDILHPVPTASECIAMMTEQVKIMREELQNWKPLTPEQKKELDKKADLMVKATLGTLKNDV
jgi:hypothetical protein